MDFTPRAQQVLAMARREADRLNHQFVGTEHILLGLTCLGQGEGCGVLMRLGFDLFKIQEEVVKQIGTGPTKSIVGQAPYTPRVKKVLAYARNEARALNHPYVGTEHLLLGLLRDGDGVAPKVLRALHPDVELEIVRAEILKVLAPDNQPMRINPSKTTQYIVQSSSAYSQVDASKRYDVYIREDGDKLVLYRNVFFRERTTLLGVAPYDPHCQFLVLELEDKRLIYVSIFSVVKFCAPELPAKGEVGM
jgi:ATP-dependent Clp protease ATP-binding subunit ClpA